MVTRLRQRLVRERQERRGRKIDPAWAPRTLLLRGYDPLSARTKTRLDLIFASDDPWRGYAVPMAVWAGSEPLILVPGSGSQP
jgi:hypothetical protein